MADQVREWVENHEISVVKPLQLIPISNGGKDDEPVKIQDLSVLFGYPYLFQVILIKKMTVLNSLQHANDCEHLLVFMDIRLLHCCDPQYNADYPLITNKPNPRRIVCKCCILYSAKWETREDELSDEDPSFWCETCFKLFHYDKEGKRTHNFKAKPFIDPAPLI